MLHSYYRHPPTAAPLTAPPSLCSHLMRSQEGRREPHARYQRHSKLTLLSSNRIKRASALVSVRKKTRRKERGSRVTMSKRDTAHRAAEMQRPPDDLPSAAPRSRHSLLPPPRPPPALRLHNTSQEKETADEKGGTHLVLHCATVSFSVPHLFLLCRVRFDLPSCLEASASAQPPTGYCAMKCSSRLIRWHLDCD